MIDDIFELKKDARVVSLINSRIDLFRENQKKDNIYWFSELCFCILTANSSASLGIRIQDKIGPDGFLNLSLTDLREVLKEEGHRFYKKRAEYILEARRYKNIKDMLIGYDNEKEMREWLVSNIKGISYKESSHFLRNVGYLGLAIIDRHILRVMYDHNLIETIPKTLTRRRYLDLEAILEDISDAVRLRPGELDLYLWYTQTGRVLK
ncbi:MAG TPA: N-glycosylase/DNA lyase [Halobacteria archaeon]|nr:N-glycosylase/DNA lyase [Halobacteria archaeon]HIH78538.1 N-glycosylase/DNA lyase [Halobacteria archaeon]